ncbi:hypothetical protein F5Y13DRAFT_205125 [Hypoxylon sp. FL1857]|nr:hypothetical protein F5Y13DRAFT_205125 [Hypoxylon sp. FL1857]
MEPNIPPAYIQQQQSQEQVAEMNSIIHEIQAIYDANTPLFTKDAIRKVGDELALFQKGVLNSGEITLKGINGVDYKVFIDPPRHNSSRNQHIGGSTWIIIYHSIESLTTYTNGRFFFPQTAYLPMEITACTREMDYFPEHDEKPPILSTEDLHRAFQDVNRQFRISEYQERLKVALAALEIPFVLDKVVALALGPLIAGNQACDGNMIQHALVSVVHSSLLQRGILSAASRRYVQDPIYTQKDRDVLSSEGFTILDDPQAFLVLDESSILVSICPDNPVKQIVADICRPGIIIWDKGNDSYPATDPTSSRVARMIEEEYREVGFPYHEALSELVMYIRRPA